MLSTPRKAVNALFRVVIFFAASIATNTMAQSQDDCISFTSSSTAGNLEGVSIDPVYFSCADGGFLVAVEASYYASINALSWTCSTLEEIGSFSSDSTGDGSVSFSVGITGVLTGVLDGILPLLADMYIGGYDVDSTGDDILFSWKGALGEFDDDEEVLQATSASYCGSGAFATGVTVWASSAYVYGVRLECATVTDTCSPPNYPTSLLEGMSGSSTDGSSSDSSRLIIIICASVAGGLLVIAIAVGVACCICRRQAYKTPRHDETRQTTAAVGPTAAAKERYGTSTTSAKEGVRPTPSAPPPVYAEPPSYFDAPPPAFS